MPPFITLDEVRAYAHLNVPKHGLRLNQTCEEYAHNTVLRLCWYRSMTMELLYTTLYRVANKYPYSVEPCERAVYEQYLQAMQLGKKHDAL